MDRTIAWVFPGQGSQFVGMASDLAGAYTRAAEVLGLAGQVLGPELLRIMAAGPEEALTATEVAQPALLTHSAAVTRVLEDAGLQPHLVAGHSLGEYSALVAAGGLDLESALRLVRERGLAMAEAGRERGGAMAAVLGLEAARLPAVVAQAAEVGTLVVANYNSPGQVVLSGTVAAVERARELSKAAGATRTLLLKVSGAFHSPLMAPAAERIRPLLEAAPLENTAWPLVSNVDAVARTDAEEIRAGLLAQSTSSVRWAESMEAMLAAGVNCFVEVGPGQVLTRLVQRMAPDVETFSTSEVAGVQAVLEALG